MAAVAILGAGELGAALAQRLADTGHWSKVVLVDPDEGKAKGKALDIMQSGPVEGSDTQVVGAASLEAVGAAEAWVVADMQDAVAGTAGLPPPASFVKQIVSAVGGGVLLTARTDGAGLVAAATRAGVARHRVLGTAPLATASALKRRLGDELGTGAAGVATTVLGLPPSDFILPQGVATVGGIPVTRLSPVAERRAVAAAKARPPGPVALAAAAAGVLRALFGSAGAVLPVFAALEGEYGHRRIAMAVPARLGLGRIQGIVEMALDPVDRVAFDTLAARAFAATFA